MTELTPKEREILNRGQAASHTLNQLTPVLDRVEAMTLVQIKQEYQSGKHTESKLLALAAKLCTLDDIKNAFKSDIIQSEAVSRKMELNNGSN